MSSHLLPDWLSRRQPSQGRSMALVEVHDQRVIDRMDELIDRETFPKQDALDRAAEATSCMLTEAKIQASQAEQDIADATERLRRANIAIAMGEAAQAKLDMHPPKPVPAEEQEPLG